MNDPPGRSDLARQRTAWAERRTDWAEDRTIMANERTFAGWLRTGLASVGIGLGFHAVFGQIAPVWLAKVLASAFILIGIAIFLAAQARAATVARRLECHKAEPMRGLTMRLVAGGMILASAGLAAAIWLMETGSRAG
jgi:putative membrane protein